MLSVDTYRMDTLAASGIPHSRLDDASERLSCVALNLYCPLCLSVICHWDCAVFILRSAANQQGVNRLQQFAVLGQVLGHTLGRGSHARFAFLPASRAHFAVFFGELQGVDDAQHFVHVAP